MKLLRFTNTHSDTLGIITSILCLLHCLGIPLFFMFHTESTEEAGHHHNLWWSSLDYIFLAISFFAIRKSAKNTSKINMKYALFCAWLVLCVVILNEKVNLLPLPESAIYIPSLALVGLHYYNLKYCQC